MENEGLLALERIVELAKYDVDLEYDFKDLRKDKELIEKELKALEIIKEKPQATLWYIQTFSDEMEYEYMPSFFKEDITKEQFNLLKEVLK